MCNYQIFLGCLFSFWATTKAREYGGDREEVAEEEGEGEEEVEKGEEEEEDEWKEETGYG